MRGAIVALERQWYRQVDREHSGPSFWAQVKTAGARLLAAFGPRSTEPRIWTRTDHLGQTWWYARDPITDQRLTQASEAEVRVWLESRYYR